MSFFTSVFFLLVLVCVVMSARLYSLTRNRASATVFVVMIVAMLLAVTMIEPVEQFIGQILSGLGTHTVPVVLGLFSVISFVLAHAMDNMYLSHSTFLKVVCYIGALLTGFLLLGGMFIDLSPVILK